MHFCPGNFLHPKTSHTLHVDPESKNAAHTKYLDPIPKTLKRSQLSQEFWRRWHMDSKKATQLIHYTLLLCIFVLAYLGICGKEVPPSVTRSRFVTAAWLSCQWWGKTVKPNLFTAAVTLYFGNELSLALNKDTAQATVISSHPFSTEFQCWFSTQEIPTLWKNSKWAKYAILIIFSILLIWQCINYFAMYKSIHSLHCSSVAHLEKVVTTSIWKIMYCNKGWQFTSKPYCKEQSHLHKNQGYSQCTI